MAMMKRISEVINVKLKQIRSEAIMVGCALRISEQSIIENKYEHLGIKFDKEKLIVPDLPVYPPDSIGSVSSININGYEVIHKEKPKVIKDIYLGARPNYGDWSKGSFSLWQQREVYQRSFIQPRGFSILCTEKPQDIKGYRNIIFTIIPNLLKTAADFEDNLLFALSLLKENIKYFDIFSSDTTLEEIVLSRKVNWEIFPPGKRDFNTELSKRLQSSDLQKKEKILARAKYIESLKPKQFIIGAGLNSNYYGALFEDDLVVFENLDYGNATYILYENWEILSHKSRTEILNSDSRYDRIIHNKEWEKALKEVLYHEKQRIRRFRK